MEPGICGMMQVMGAARLVDPLEMEGQDIGVFGIQALQLKLVQVGKQWKVIVFSKVNMRKIATLHPRCGLLENGVVTLHFALMIERAKPWVFDENLVRVRDFVEVRRFSPVRQQQVVGGNSFAPPPLGHQSGCRRGLMGDDQIENAFHEENPETAAW